jgi:low affinity Fe/Cu permease
MQSYKYSINDLAGMGRAVVGLILRLHRLLHHYLACFMRCKRLGTSVPFVVMDSGLPTQEASFMNDFFRAFANKTAGGVGSPWAFLLAVTIIIIWTISGPLFGFSDTWQLVINTGTTIITFLMVFLIQNTQNRDAKAIHLKLDELLRGVKGARTGLVDLENLNDKELARLQAEFERLHKSEQAKTIQGQREKAAKQKQR